VSSWASGDAWERVDVHAKWTALTLDIIGAAAFGGLVGADSSAWGSVAEGVEDASGAAGSERAIGAQTQDGGSKRGQWVGLEDEKGNGRSGPVASEAIDYLLRDLQDDIMSLRFFIPLYRSLPFLPWNAKRRGVCRALEAQASQVIAARRTARARGAAVAASAAESTSHEVLRLASGDAAWKGSGERKEEALKSEEVEWIEGKDKEKTGKDPVSKDLLDWMLDASGGRRECDKQSADDVEAWIRSQAMTFVAAGHETTAKLLTWTLLLLTQFPVWAERLRAEVDRSVARTAARGTDWPQFSDLADLHVLEAIVHESLRVFSPVQQVGRTATRDVWIGTGTDAEGVGREGPQSPVSEGGALFIAKGMGVSVNIQLIHRDLTRWPMPDHFDPARFLTDDQVRHLGLRRLSVAEATVGGAPADPDALDDLAMPYAGKFPDPFNFLPFIAGPRNCIGANFALLEARVLLAVAARRTEWRIGRGGYLHKPTLAVTLRPALGMPLMVRRRTNKAE
jgi:cytochrome P450